MDRAGQYDLTLMTRKTAAARDFCRRSRKPAKNQPISTAECRPPNYSDLELLSLTLLQNPLDTAYPVCIIERIQ
jgi:hypothetical protein